MQYYRPSLHKQQWICYVYRSATCTFSKSSGPVRYTPKVRKLSYPKGQDEHAGSSLSHSIDSTQAHKLPSEAHKGIIDPSLAEWGSLGTRHKAEAHTTSGFCVDEENNIDIDKDRETCSCEVLGAQVSSNHAPVYSLHSLDPGALLNPHDHLNGDKDRKELISKEDRTVQPAYVRLQDAGNHYAETARQSSRSSAYVQRPPLPTYVMQTGKNVASHKDFVQTREKDFFTVKAERKTLLHVAEESPHLTHQDKHIENKEADILARKVPPWQDAESFILKVQRAKQRCIEPFGMPHTAAAENSGADVNNEIADSNLSDDNEFMLLKQETLEYRNNDYRACLESHSVAELEHAKNQAVRYLSMRPYTAAELRKKLIGRNIEPGLADYAIGTVQSCGLQSDIAYAETFSLGRFKYSGWGPQRIKMSAYAYNVPNVEKRIRAEAVPLDLRFSARVAPSDLRFSARAVPLDLLFSHPLRFARAVSSDLRFQQ
ncbi:hypothetical protein L7F22_059830 [Adiantum nelumboides]|nr:hypothetical protein [Adiantum nelumboides]